MPADCTSDRSVPEDVLRRELQRIIAAGDLYIAMQPIVHLRSGEVIGYEALTRLNDCSVLGDAGALFDAASRLGLLNELEVVCRETALRAAASWQSDALLFMNNSPSVMTTDGFIEALTDAARRSNGFSPRRLVLEITERTEQADLQGLDERTMALRELGFEIALDDVGAGLSGLNRIMMLRPNWVKLDRELIADIDHDPIRQNLLRALLQFVKLSNMSLIAEGIERYEELAVLVEMGVPYGQGYFLAQPAAGEPRVDDLVRQCIARLSERAEARRFEHPTVIRLASLANPVPTFQSSTASGEVLERLDDPGVPDHAAILDGRRFQGLIGRAELRRNLDGRSPDMPIGLVKVHLGSPIAADITLAEALEIAAGRADDEMTEPLAVQEQGRIIGVVTLRSLLQSAADAHRHAPHLAALSMLPTRVQADQWIASRIRSGHPANIAFIDLRGFDAYNLAYGFEMGDTMLLRLVGLMRAVMTDAATDQGLLAHLGEDRFLTAFPDDRRAALRRLADDFIAARGEFFSAADLEAAEFNCPDPDGRFRIYPLTTVRVVYLERPLQHVGNARELHELAHSLRLAATDDFGEIVFERRVATVEQRRTA